MGSEIDPSSIIVALRPFLVDNATNQLAYAYYDQNLGLMCDGVMHPDGTASLRVIDDILQCEVGTKIISLDTCLNFYDYNLAQESLARALTPVMEALRRRPTNNQSELPLA